MAVQDVAYVNGVFSDLASATISINDRGFQFGDGVYEVIRTVNGVPLFLDEHLTRLAESTGTMGFQRGPWLTSLPQIVREGLLRSKHPECLVYIQITRGIQPRNHIPDADLTPSVVVTFRAFTEVAAEHHMNGISVRTFPDLRHHLCQWKTTNLLAHTLAKAEARREGNFEAIFVRDGYLSEGSSSSLFLVKDGQILTPAIGDSVLPGVTRDHVLNDFAARIGVPANERPVSIADLSQADEVFVATTSYFVLPVIRIDGNLVGNGKPGALTKQLQAAYSQFLNSLTQTAQLAAR